MASSVIPTFQASLRAVGTASTMAFAGFYLHRRGFVTPSGKKMMALLSQQVTIPAFLFAKIIYCPPGSGSGGDLEAGDGVLPDIVCPSVANRISDLWMLLLWPFYVVLCGLATGYAAAKASGTPPMQTNSCLAACAFANSTGLPITLLTVIHKQFKKTTELGTVDPTALLSVYLLLYPVLQWGVGGWLLAPEEKTDDAAVDTGKADAEMNLAQWDSVHQSNANGHSRRPSLHISHLLNREPLQSPTLAAGQEEFGGVKYRRLVYPNDKAGGGDGAREDGHWYSAGVGSSDTLAMMVQELSFTNIASSEDVLSSPKPRPSGRSNGSLDGDAAPLLPHPASNGSFDGPLTMDHADDSGEASAALESLMGDIVAPPTIHEHVPFTSNGGAIAVPEGGDAPSKSFPEPNDGGANYDTMTLPRHPAQKEIRTIQEADVLPLTETLVRIAGKVFQPPVIGALGGLLVASFPTLRGLLQNIWGETRPAPLKWMFDGIYSVGQAAVPINMTILGINLSSTFQKKSTKSAGDGERSKTLPNQTMLALVVAKMLVMPSIGIVSTWFMRQYFKLPDEIDATCYLVMMIVFITPTANNVMVMVELSGSSSKEGMAKLIGWQYVVSPVVLSFVLAVVVNLASCHFDAHPKCST